MIDSQDLLSRGVTIVRNPYVKGFPKVGEPAYPLELGQALERAYSSDAHFAQYRSPIVAD